MTRSLLLSLLIAASLSATPPWLITSTYGVSLASSVVGLAKTVRALKATGKSVKSATIKSVRKVTRRKK